MNMKTPWEFFFENAVRAALQPGARIIDVGGGLRFDASRGNVALSSNAWIKPLADRSRYEIMDKVDTYHPDIVGDIMAMPLADASADAIVCLSVLEHVPRPWDAAREIYRVLKPDGFFFAYAPFLSPYHAMRGYYGDYFRFTEDGVRALFAEFRDLRLQVVRGPIETLAHLLPGRLHHSKLIRLARWFDGLRRSSGKQAAGYYVTGKK